MKKSKFLKTLGLLTLLCSLLFSCERNVEEEVLPEIISFSQNVKPIIDSRCVECHMGNRFPDLRTLQSIQTNANAIQSAVVSLRMPVGSSLSNQQIAAIRDWIDAGALDN